LDPICSSVIGREELIEDPRFATNEEAQQERRLHQRNPHRVDPKRTPRKRRCRSSAPRAFRGAVHDTLELQNDPSFEKRGIMQVNEAPDGDWKCEAWPVRFDGKLARAEALAKARPAHATRCSPVGSR